MLLLFGNKNSVFDISIQRELMYVGVCITLMLYVLTYFRNLVDQPQDNVLDAAEFTAAVHLIQQTMRGIPLPKDTLPPCLIPQGKRSEVRIPTMNRRELCAYRKLFEMLDKNTTEHVTSKALVGYLKWDGGVCVIRYKLFPVVAVRVTINTHTHTHTHTSVYVCVCVYVCVHTDTDTDTHKCVYV